MNREFVIAELERMIGETLAGRAAISLLRSEGSPPASAVAEPVMAPLDVVLCPACLSEYKRNDNAQWPSNTKCALCGMQSGHDSKCPYRKTTAQAATVSVEAGAEVWLDWFFQPDEIDESRRKTARTICGRIIAAALAARTTDASAASEVVAWLKEWDNIGDSSDRRRCVDFDSVLGSHMRNAKVTPLFTHPAGAGADADAMEQYLALSIEHMKTTDHAEEDRLTDLMDPLWNAMTERQRNLFHEYNITYYNTIITSSPQQRAGDGG